MGWSGGSEIAAKVWSAVRPHIPQRDKEFVARQIIDAFEDADCDTMSEAEDLWAAAGFEHDDES